METKPLLTTAQICLYSVSGHTFIVLPQPNKTLLAPVQVQLLEGGFAIPLVMKNGALVEAAAEAPVKDIVSGSQVDFHLLQLIAPNFYSSRQVFFQKP